jgi:hypothetical protein
MNVLKPLLHPARDVDLISVRHWAAPYRRWWQRIIHSEDCGAISCPAPHLTSRNISVIVRLA